MNYLAHFHLSDGDDNLIIGALLGDFVKGPLNGVRIKPIEQGIQLHRKIDAFTDSHRLLKQCHQQFDPTFRRFAGIMTDVVFDHFLNIHWQQFNSQPLPLFSERIYQLLDDNEYLPPSAQYLADRLSEYDVFGNFRHWQTVKGALLRISQRLKRDNPLPIAATELEKNYHLLEETFLAFYPQLQQHVLQQRQLFLHDKRTE